MGFEKIFDFSRNYDVILTSWINRFAYNSEMYITQTVDFLYNRDI